MNRVPPEALVELPMPERSETVAARIVAARGRQASRAQSNSRLAGRALLAAARLSKQGERRLIDLATLEGLSARGTERLIRVARTVADLAAAERVLPEHLEEAARFRAPARHLADRKAAS
jgi:magnesium chelatase family protein